MYYYVIHTSYIFCQLIVILLEYAKIRVNNHKKSPFIYKLKISSTNQCTKFLKKSFSRNFKKHIEYYLNLIPWGTKL